MINAYFFTAVFKSFLDEKYGREAVQDNDEGCQRRPRGCPDFSKDPGDLTQPCGSGRGSSSDFNRRTSPMAWDHVIMSEVFI